MGRRDERSGTTSNNTTSKPSEKQLGEAWLRKHADKSPLTKADEAAKLNQQQRAGKDDRN